MPDKSDKPPLEIEKLEMDEKEDHRYDRAAIAMQVEQAFVALLDGYRAPQVVRTLMSEHGIGQTQAYERIKAANAEIYRKSDRKFEEEFEKHYKRLERLYNMCIKAGDRRTANQVIKQISDLFGLEAPKRTDITSGGEKIVPNFVDVLGVQGHVVEPREVMEETKEAEVVIREESEEKAESGNTEDNKEASGSPQSDTQLQG